MTIWTIIKVANRNLFRNKLRTFLTISAIFIGSFTLTLTNGLGDGLRAYVETQVKNLEAANVVFVRKKFEQPGGKQSGDAPQEYRESSGGEQMAFDPNAVSFTREQLIDALRGADGIVGVTPSYDIRGEYITIEGGKKYTAELGMLSEGLTLKTEAGRTIDGPQQIVLPVGLARAFNADISSLIGRQAVVGYKTAEGELKTRSLEIVGVATKGFMVNTNSFVDAETAHAIYDEQTSGTVGAGRFQNFTVQLASANEEAVKRFKARLEEKGLVGETLAERKKRTYDAIGIFKAGMNLFAFIALLAASFGIINTLIIAVLERTKEIGLQKALGMGRGKIFLIFTLEAVFIGFWGAVIGTIAGIVAGIAANKLLVTSFLTSFEGYNLFAFTLPSIAVVIGIVSLIAFAAGVLPAIRASRLNPIESLRYE